MEYPVSAVFKGKDSVLGFAGYILEKNFFFVLKIEDGLSQVQGKAIIEKIKEEHSKYSVQNLATLEQFISHLVTRYNLPASFSIAVGYAKQEILYLKTIGQGSIYLRRGDSLGQIIGGDKSASGYIRENDFYIFTTKGFIDILEPGLGLNKLTAGKSPDEVVEELSSLTSVNENEGLIALFSEYLPELAEEETKSEKFAPAVVKSEVNNPLDLLKKRGGSFLESLQQLSERSGKKKIFTLVAVVVIFLILTWSVVLGYQRRSIAEVNRKVSIVKESVNQKIKEAEESAFLNLNKSINLLAEAKKEVADLKKEVGSDNKGVKEIEESVKEAERRVVKKEEKNYEEFFDLTLDSKGARGNKLYLQAEDLSIIDQGKSTIYSLSLSKKSLDRNNAGQVKNALLVTSYQDYKIFNVEKGDIYKLTSDNKVNKVIAKDGEWGKIVDMWIFNGNLYLLDSIKGDIYKYLVTENGYSEKSSYLGGNAGSIKEALSIAIDASVYVAFEDEIVKFTAGARDDFKTSWPEKNISLTKVFTNEDVEKVYAWSKSKGAVYVLNKNGTYERQINSSILTKAVDFVVYDDSAYVLVGEKIYSIDL